MTAEGASVGRTAPYNRTMKMFFARTKKGAGLILTQLVRWDDKCAVKNEI